MQILAGKHKTTGEIVYSRHVHDFRTLSDGSGMDGGQIEKYYRIVGDLELVHIELPEVKNSDLMNDYQSGMNHYGYIDKAYAETLANNIGKVSSPRFLMEYELIDRDSYEFRKYNKVWGTYGKDGKSKLKWKNITDLDWDHIEAILTTQRHIKGSEIEQMLKEILLEKRFTVTIEDSSEGKRSFDNVSWADMKSLVLLWESEGRKNYKITPKVSRVSGVND